MYKVTKCRGRVKKLQEHCDTMEKEGWLLISLSSKPNNQFIFIWYKK